MNDEFRDVPVDVSVDNPDAMEDYYKAVLFTFVAHGQIPDWGTGDPMLVMAVLCGWSHDRARAAFFKAEELGHIKMDLKPFGNDDDVVLQ